MWSLISLTYLILPETSDQVCASDLQFAIGIIPASPHRVQETKAFMRARDINWYYEGLLQEGILIVFNLKSPASFSAVKEYIKYAAQHLVKYIYEG